MPDFDELMRQGRDGHATITPRTGGRVGQLSVVSWAPWPMKPWFAGFPTTARCARWPFPLSPLRHRMVTLRWEAEILRQGKAVTQVESRLYQNDDQVVLVALGSFGVSRDSVVAVEPEPAPDVKEPEGGYPMPQMEGVNTGFPASLRHAFRSGRLSVYRLQRADHGGWMRFREAPEAITASHLVALVDTWPSGSVAPSAQTGASEQPELDYGAGSSAARNCPR